MGNMKVHTRGNIYKLEVITPRMEWDGIVVFHYKSLIYLYFEHVLL